MKKEKYRRGFPFTVSIFVKYFKIWYNNVYYSTVVLICAILWLSRTEIFASHRSTSQDLWLTAGLFDIVTVNFSKIAFKNCAPERTYCCIVLQLRYKWSGMCEFDWQVQMCEQILLVFVPCSYLHSISFNLLVLNMVEIMLWHLVMLQLASLLCQGINCHKEQVY
jgi:hypothetical protein